jgi:NADH-quinone oxidoreductase subunit H
LVAGYHTEYSGIKFMMFFMAEYMHIVTISAIAVTLFFGGWNGPHPHFLTPLWPVLWFLAKTSAFVFLFFWLRASLPRLRYDQLMNVGWKFLIPIGLVWIPASAAIHIFSRRSVLIYGAVAVIALLILSMFISFASRTPESESEEAPVG